MNVVFIIPTGLGCEIGGHAGDASPAAKLIAAVCDKFITHPNVFNASDINEMPENTLYVEGSILDRFLRGEIYLREIYTNKILLAVNDVNTDTINAVSGARATIGAEIDVIKLDTPLLMKAHMRDGRASGEVIGWEYLVEQVESYDFDALAIQTKIDVDKDVARDYLTNGGINPWGGVEAKGSKFIADGLDKPVAHSPVGDTLTDFSEVVDPRMAAEMVSITYLHCILKGLHRAPRVDYDRGLSIDDIDFLISPIGCWGEPHLTCDKAGIPIIAVRENTNCMNEPMGENTIIVNNYLEAAGVLIAAKAGVSIPSLSRPLPYTKVINNNGDTNGQQ